jgi:hypothetical protein
MLLDYQYQEWSLREDTRIPGEACVREFFQTLPFHCVIRCFLYRLDKSRNRYKFFHCIDGEAICSSGIIPSSLHDVFLVIVKLNKNCSGELLQNLLDHFQLEEADKQLSSENTDLFSSPIDWGDGLSITQDETLLIVHHDGNPLILLSN